EPSGREHHQSRVDHVAHAVDERALQRQQGGGLDADEVPGSGGCRARHPRERDRAGVHRDPDDEGDARRRRALGVGDAPHADGTLREARGDRGDRFVPRLRRRLLLHRRALAPVGRRVRRLSPPQVAAASAPPSTTMWVPLIHAESSEARKRAQRAMSSGSPTRPSGICRPVATSRSTRSMMSAVSRVRMVPGQIAFTRMRSDPYDAAMAWVRASTAPFEAAYAWLGRDAEPRKALTDAGLMIDPPPDQRISGTAARLTR